MKVIRFSPISKIMTDNLYCTTFNFRIFLAVFVVTAAPFGFFNVTKTKYLQILTSLMRWLAFTAMVTLACIRLSNGNIYHPKSVAVDGIPNMFGVCVYSFMCHHSLPSLGNLSCLIDKVCNLTLNLAR